MKFNKPEKIPNQYRLLFGDVVEKLFLAIITNWLLVDRRHFHVTLLHLNVSNQQFLACIQLRHQVVHL